MKHTLTLFLALLCVCSVHAAAPTVPATNLSFNIVDGGYMNVGWKPGNGARRIMIARAGEPVTAVPQNGVDYQENTVFGNGQQIAAGQYVVYDNAFTSFYLTGLAPSTTYYFAVFEYNGTGAAIEYLTASFLSGHASTATTPTTQASQIVFSNITATSATIGLQAGNGARRLIVAREGSAVNTNPVLLTPYGGNSVFGSGTQMGAGNYSVSNSSASTVNITNLKAGTTYHFAVYEFNGSSEPVYLIPGVTATVTTRTIPTVASSNITVTKTDGKELTISWEKGNGQRRIVVAKQASAVTGLPVNGMDYTASEQFGTGASLATGEYVMYNGTGNAAVLSGLNAATTYHIRVYEFDGTGNTTTYLTSAFAEASAPTAAKPTLQATNIVASNVQAEMLTLGWQNGNGRARLLVMRKNAAVSMVPQDFTSYTPNVSFGNGQQVGDGNYIISNSPGNFTSIHNLQPNTVYHVAIFEFNGFNQPLYLTPAAVFQVTTAGSLPVVLSSWTAQASNDAVLLKWTTQSEINAHHFLVQRSSDGLLFENIQSVNAKGNSTIPTHYDSKDANPRAGKNYYRLQMVDKDGSSRYSPVINLHIQAHANLLSVANGQNHIIARMTGNPQKTQWSLVNISGQVLESVVLQSNQWQVSTTALAPGVYFIIARTEDNTFTARVIKN